MNGRHALKQLDTGHFTGLTTRVHKENYERLTKF